MPTAAPSRRARVARPPAERAVSGPDAALVRAAVPDMIRAVGAKLAAGADPEAANALLRQIADLGATAGLSRGAMLDALREGKGLPQAVPELVRPHGPTPAPSPPFKPGDRVTWRKPRRVLVGTVETAPTVGPDGTVWVTIHEVQAHTLGGKPVGKTGRYAVPADLLSLYSGPAAPLALPRVDRDARPPEAAKLPILRTLDDLSAVWTTLTADGALAADRRAELRRWLGPAAPRPADVLRVFERTGGWVPWGSSLAAVLWSAVRKGTVTRDLLRPAMLRADAVNGHDGAVYTDGHFLVVGPGAARLENESKAWLRRHRRPFEDVWVEIEAAVYPDWRRLVAPVSGALSLRPVAISHEGTGRATQAPPRAAVVWMHAGGDAATAKWDGWASYAAPLIAAVVRYTVPSAAARGGEPGDMDRLNWHAVNDGSAATVTYADPATQVAHEARHGVEPAALLMPVARNRYNPAGERAPVQADLFERANPSAVADGVTVAYLGTVDRLTVLARGRTLDYSADGDDTVMVWMPERRRLLLVPRKRTRWAPPAHADRDPAAGAGRRAHETWEHASSTGRALALDLPAAALAKRLPAEAGRADARLVGAGDTIWYRSTKLIEPGDQGTVHGYVHPFDRGRRLVFELDYPDGGPPVLAVSGLQINGRGILN